MLFVILKEEEKQKSSSYLVLLMSQIKLDKFFFLSQDIYALKIKIFLRQKHSFRATANCMS